MIGKFLLIGLIAQCQIRRTQFLVRILSQTVHDGAEPRDVGLTEQPGLF